jgi:hypothetical protein
MQQCSLCRGTGFVKNTNNSLMTCPACSGITNPSIQPIEKIKKKPGRPKSDSH